jgi:hypothetical protein
MSLDRDQSRFVNLGIRLFGEQDWHADFARWTGLSRPYVSMIARGERPVTDAVKAAVVAGLKTELRRVRERGMIVKRALEEYE